MCCVSKTPTVLLYRTLLYTVLYYCAAPIFHCNDVWENSRGAEEMDLQREC